MMKCNELIWCPTNMLLKLLLISFLLQHSLGFGISDDEKRTGLIPLSQIGRNRLLAALEDKNMAGGLIAYPRLGRHVWELQQALLPYPRAGRLIIDPSSLDYDIFLKADLNNDDSLTDAFLTSGPIIQKRGNVKLIPRIGRKKRSVSDAGEKKDSESERNNQESDHGRSIWNNLDDLDTDYFFRGEKKMSKNAFAPRIGKKRSGYSDGYDENNEYFKGEEKKMSKNAFAPRIGKKWSEYPDVYDEKRAAAFTPRIGRAALIPRIGRSDPRFRLRGRAAFVPRIGRRAALIPRIGRSESQRTLKVDTD